MPGKEINTTKFRPEIKILRNLTNIGVLKEGNQENEKN